MEEMEQIAELANRVLDRGGELSWGDQLALQILTGRVPPPEPREPVAPERVVAWLERKLAEARRDCRRGGQSRARSAQG